MTRRHFFGALQAAAWAQSGARQRPNIVFFLSDDHGFWDSPIYGSKVVRTPAMQELAASGMVFDRAFTGSPTCVPSRAIIMSGLMPARNGALPNHSGVSAGIATMPAFLNRAIAWRTSGRDIFSRRRTTPISSGSLARSNADR